MDYSIEEFDRAKTKVMNYIMYKKRTEYEVKNKFSKTLEENLLDDIIEYVKEVGYLSDTEYIKRAITEFKALNNLSRKEVKYDFVEVMACPGGCVGGGGQPINCEDIEMAGTRSKILHNLDSNMPIRYSHENQDVKELYNDLLQAPLSHKSEELLHVNH